MSYVLKIGCGHKFTENNLSPYSQYYLTDATLSNVRLYTRARLMQ